MEEISVRDLRMMYKDSVVFWKGTPVFIKNIAEDYRFTIWDLAQQRIRFVKWIPENFIAPAVRIGYINLGTNCIYAHRTAIRRYKVGLCNENVVRIHQEHALNAYEDEEASRVMALLQSTSLYNALVGNYPSLTEAFEEAKEGNGVVAFDKQFAVSHKGIVFYKGRTVGRYVRGEVEFKPEESHLVRALISK